MSEDITNGLGVEIRLNDPNDFLKIKETLTRIGIASKKNKTLYQTCHILHKQGRYFIMMFKELFAMDGKSTNFSDEDRERRNMIVRLLESWKLLIVIEPDKIQSTKMVVNIKVIPFKEKAEWTLIPKYQIGTKRTS